MKIYLLLFIFVFTSGLGFCQSVKKEAKDDKIIIIEKKENKKYNLRATFYGEDYGEESSYVDEDGIDRKIITNITFRDNNTGEEVKYKPTGGFPAGNYYFTDIWSPGEEYLVLPIGMFEGYAIFESKDALKNIKENKYFDTIKVKSVNSGWFWHDFQKWEDDSTFFFRAGLDGDMFAFKYNIEKSELYCYEEGCERDNIGDIGINKKGKIKAIKKGDIETIKKY